MAGSFFDAGKKITAGSTPPSDRKLNVTIEQPDFTEDEHYETQTANRVVYVTFVEVSPRAGCRVLNAEEYSGALMMCFLPATSPDDALARLHNRLDKEKLDIVSVEYCLDAATMDELDDEDTELARVAGAANRVLFGNIIAWDDEGPAFD